MKVKFLSRTSLLYVIALCGVGAAAAFLLNLWFAAFSAEMLFKIMVSLGVLAALAGLLLAISSDADDERSQKKDKYLN